MCSGVGPRASALVDAESAHVQNVRRWSRERELLRRKCLGFIISRDDISQRWQDCRPFIGSLRPNAGSLRDPLESAEVPDAAEWGPTAVRKLSRKEAGRTSTQLLCGGRVLGPSQPATGQLLTLPTVQVFRTIALFVVLLKSSLRPVDRHSTRDPANAHARKKHKKQPRVVVGRPGDDSACDRSII